MSMTFEEFCVSRNICSDSDKWALAMDAWLAAQAQCAAGPWQDIKDAPKEGTPVLVATADVTCVTTAYYSRAHDGWVDQYYGVRVPFRVAHFAPLRECKP